MIVWLLKITISPGWNQMKSLWAWALREFKRYMTSTLMRNLYVIVKMDVTFVDYLF